MENVKASVAFKQLRTNFVNLPANLANILSNANINPQDVIIEIITASKTKIYSGWSGLQSSSLHSVEIDPIFALSAGIAENSAIVVNVKINNFLAKTINVEPETPSDWELVELHAGTLEDTLLTQARCVAVNQTVVVFPSKTSSVKLIVRDIGTKDHVFGKIDPYAEIAIAPKQRQKRTNSVAKSSKSSRSSRVGSEDYSNMPNVMKRAITLPHDLFGSLPQHANPDGYEVYLNFNEVFSLLNSAEFVAVSLIPGPSQKFNTVEPTEEKEKFSVPLKENKRVVAKIVNFTDCPPNTVGLSYKLAVALSAEYSVGSLAVLKPAVKFVNKRPATFTVHPYIVQTKKTNQVNINLAEKKEAEAKRMELLASFLYNEVNPLSLSPITNYCKIPKIPHLLPNGGLLKFKRNDDVHAWIKPYDLENKRVPKFELGEELLRNASFLEEDKPTDDIDEVIGLDSTIDTIVQSIVTFRNSGTLVHGNSGSGKTLVAKIIADALNSKHGYHTKFVSCETIMNENYTQLCGHITKWIQECSWHKPSLLVLDNLDKLLSAEQEHADSTQSKQLTEYFVSHLQKVHQQANSNISILATGLARESFNGFLFQSHLVENFTHLSVPDKTARHDIIQKYTASLGCDVLFDIMDIVSETEGYLPNDLKTLCDRMYHETLFSEKKDISKSIFDKAFEGFTPSNLRGVKLQKSSTNWSDIGGLTEAKNIMLETLEWPTKYAPIFANCPLRLRSGILLYGYPGCGKTLLASAIAGQCGLNFISIKGPEILNKYIGASEQSVRELFERAQSAKPCILFFDEFDSIAPKRGHDSTGVTDRVVNQMLTQMDGAEGLDGVYVLAATSRPDLIDSALLRPGRLDKSVICDMPNYNDRLDILKTITEKMELDTDVDLESIAEKTSGFSGADMQGLGYNAYLKAVHVKLMNDEQHALKGESQSSKKTYDFFQVNSDKLKSNKLRPADRVKLAQKVEQLFNDEKDVKEKTISSNEETKVKISRKNFEESLAETKPSISVIEKQKLSNIYRKFVSGRDGNMPDGSASNDIGGRTTLM